MKHAHTHTHNRVLGPISGYKRLHNPCARLLYFLHHMQMEGEDYIFPQQAALFKYRAAVNKHSKYYSSSCERFQGLRANITASRFVSHAVSR